MTDQTNKCRADRIVALASGEISSDDAAWLETHLDRCESCREALEASVASRDVWDSVRSLNSVSTSDNVDRTDFADEADLQYYRSMFGPTDNPEMLGRIGTYEIVGLLGSGGMGVVFKGFDAALNRYVAIKILAPHFASNVAAKQRFLREAQAAAAVAHEHVIAIHGVSSYLQTPYLVMPYIAGVSLQQRLAQSGAFTLRETLRIGMQVASGLAAAHAQGLIHRDVKPANILMESGVDRVVLTDFGIACAVDDVRLTQTDSLIGTPQYMSPEQATDQPLDYRTDLFSLGSVLYETCCGRPAFHAATSYGILRKLSESQPVPLRDINPDVPDWLERLINRLMSKARNDRFESAATVERVLKQCLAHVEQPLLVDLPSEVAASAPRRFSVPNWSYVMLTIVATVTLAATVIYFERPSVAPSVPPSQSVLRTEKLDPTGDHVTIPTAAPMPQETTAPTPRKYQSAKEAFGVGAAFYNARNYKEAREPFEAVLELTNDPQERLKAYSALIASYRLIPEFEPFQKAAEYVIEHTQRDAERSLTRRSYLSFAYQRGQLDNLIKRYEARLAKDRNDYLSVYLLSEIYSVGDRNPKRAIELLNQLETLNAAKTLNHPPTTASDTGNNAKIAREKGKLGEQFSQAARNTRRPPTSMLEIATGFNHARLELEKAAAAYFKAETKRKHSKWQPPPTRPSPKPATINSRTSFIEI
ncbi:MAG: protein kinase [Pirellulaceae bacterium]